MKHLKLLLLLLFVTPFYAQQGGMWIPSLLKGMNEKEMKSLGIKLSPEQIYSINRSSLKDAIPQFDGGCSSGVISDKGLLLTNHHCGYEQIQSHSSVEKNYLKDGFWAKNLSEELPNPGVDATFVVSIKEVTKEVLAGVDETISLEKRHEIIQKNIDEIVKNSPKEAWQENRVRAFYEGNQYMLFVVEVFKDVRLVGAPPSSIGKFGSDTDNWVWPRHTGDFALFRIYADKNNRPAEYSKENVPYRPKNYLKVSLDGVTENTPTLILGYPGRTQEYLPEVAVKQIVTTINPAKIEIRDRTLKIQNKYMRSDDKIKIQYAAKNASIANAWKKWQGENLGIMRTDALSKIRQKEEKFSAKSKQNQEYKNILTDFEKLYSDFEQYNLAMNVFQEVVLRNSELLSNAFKLYQLSNVFHQRGEQSFSDRKNNLLKSFESFYKDYNPAVDKEVFASLMPLYERYMKIFLPENFSTLTEVDRIFEKTALTSYKGVTDLLSGSSAEVLTKIKNDQAVSLVFALSDVFYQKVYPKYDELNTKIGALQQKYMKAILEFSSPEDRIFPDANGTLRLTYGKVKGYSPRDAVYYEPVTYLDGVMEKYIPEDYEFDVPKQLRELFQQKNFGNYADKTGKLPVAFIGTNHTTGGNSGSSVVNGKGELIGLNFDRVWEGTMSDMYYDPSICRNIMVDVRYILFIIDKYAGAKNIIEELHFAPKNNKKTSRK